MRLIASFDELFQDIIDGDYVADAREVKRLCNAIVAARAVVDAAREYARFTWRDPNRESPLRRILRTALAAYDAKREGR